MWFNPFFIATVVAGIVMLTIGIFSRGRTILLPAFIFIEGIFVSLFFVFGVGGLSIAWILTFPYILAFFTLAFFFRSSGVLRLSLLLFTCLCAGLAFALNGALIIRNVIEDPNQVYNLDTFGKYLFLVAGALIVLLSATLTIITGLVIFVVRRLSKGKGQIP